MSLKSHKKIIKNRYGCIWQSFHLFYTTCILITIFHNDKSIEFWCKSTKLYNKSLGTIPIFINTYNFIQSVKKHYIFWGIAISLGRQRDNDSPEKAETLPNSPFKLSAEIDDACFVNF